MKKANFLAYTVFIQAVRQFFLLLFLFGFSNQLCSQCNNCPPASTISGEVSASTLNLSGYHPCLAINGTYNVDVNVSITSSLIYLGPGTQIKVKSGAVLDLNDCQITGCNEMWGRILVESGGKLIANDVTFEDGIDAIKAISNSQLVVKNCYFTNNYIGIHLLNKFIPGLPTQSIVFSEPLSNNIFQATASLLPPYGNQVSFAGIKVVNKGLTIGETGYPQNQFLNITNGIVCENSNIIIKNALFQVLSPTVNVSMTGISCKNGSVTVRKSVFNNCYKSVLSSGANLYVLDNNLSSSFFGVEITNSANKTIQITDNVFTNTYFYGVLATNNGVFKEFLVDKNDNIEMDFYSLGLTPVAAIRLVSSVPTNQNNVNIRDNFIDLFGSSEGIQAILNGNINIENNDVDIFHATGLSAQMEHGIRITSCGNSEIIDNNVIITSSDPNIGTIHAIELNSSENCIVCSNMVDKSGIGFKFNGQNSNTYFSNNLINDHIIGLYVGSETGSPTSAYMGVQGLNNRARDNQWNATTYADWGAENVAPEAFVAESFFHVRNSSQPQMPPSISAAVQWFADNGNGENDGCPIDELTEHPTEFEKSIADGSVPFTDYAVAELWRAQTTLYRRLKNKPELLGHDPDIDSFFDASERNAIGAFYSVSEDINDLAVPDSSMGQVYETLENIITAKMNQLSVIDSQLLITTGTLYDDLIDQRRTTSRTIDSLHLEILELDSVLLAQKITKANEIITLNASISPTSLPQEYQQSVNEVYLNTVAKGILELTSPQVSVLEPIASTCIHEGGDAVLGARILLALVNDSTEYDDDVLCSSFQPLTKPGHSNPHTLFNHEQLEIYPNPAINQIKIIFPPIADWGILDIFDQQGVLKYSTILGEEQRDTLLSLQNFPSGIYIISVKNNDYVITKKLVVLK